MSNRQLQRFNATISVLKHNKYRILSKFTIASMINNNQFIDIDTLERVGAVVKAKGALV